MGWYLFQAAVFFGISVPMYLGMTNDGIPQGQAFGSSAVLAFILTAIITGVTMRISLRYSRRRGGTGVGSKGHEPDGGGPGPRASRSLPEQFLEERQRLRIGQDLR
jgi:hypothetical protein